jgi:hypothetical protein
MTPTKLPPKPPDGSIFLGERAGGPNAAHPVTQTVSPPYLRREWGYGKLLSRFGSSPEFSACSEANFRTRATPANSWFPASLCTPKFANVAAEKAVRTLGPGYWPPKSHRNPWVVVDR